MNLRRIWILLKKELVAGPKNFFFIFAVVVPVVTSLMITLVFGDLFSGRPRIGYVDHGDSKLVDSLTAAEFLTGRMYESVDGMKAAVSTGAIDIGLVLPAGFDALLQKGERTDLGVFVYGQSLLKNRIIIAGWLGDAMVEISGRTIPVSVEPIPLGENSSAWYERMVPLLVLMAVVLGGSIVPASSLVAEKQSRTLGALTATPTSLNEVFLAKGLLGLIVSITMGVVTLLLNQAAGTQPLLLIFVLFLSAILAAAFGILLGSLTKDVNALFAIVKASGALLYAPALIYLFPGLPQWIARIFPTYYIIGPIIEITQNGGSWSAIGFDLTILVVLIGVMVTAVAVITNRTRYHPA